MTNIPTHIKQIADALACTQDANKQKRENAEKFLRTKELNQGFGSDVLKLLKVNLSNSETMKHCAAIYLKNFVKKYYGLEEKVISEQDSKFIKSNIVGCMSSSPKLVRKQLSECVTIIASKDFYKKWPNLLPVSFI